MNIQVDLQFPALPYLTDVRNAYFARHKRFPRVIVVSAEDGAGLLQEQPLLRNWGMMWHGMQIMVVERFEIARPVQVDLVVEPVVQILNDDDMAEEPVVGSGADLIEPPPIVIKPTAIVKKRPGRKPGKK